MDEMYLVEIRLGMTKWRVKETIFTIATRFRLENFIELHPHVTLFGPMSLNEGISPQQLLDTIEHIACRYDPVAFTIDGWELREGIHGSVIAFPVRPSGALKSLTTTIAGVLAPITYSYNMWDACPGKKWFHVTVANRLGPKRAAGVFSDITGGGKALPQPERVRCGIFSRLMCRLQNILPWKKQRQIRPLTLDETGFRITVMQGDTILAEYDLVQKRWLAGGDGHASRSWQDTLAVFRQRSGFELKTPCQEKGGAPFLIADLHVGHANIIRYCSRPFLFSDVAEMDRVLIENWNCVVSPASRVYYLGDLRYGKHAPGARELQKKLNGDIMFIAGNHDEAELAAVPSALLDYKGFRFLMVHDPADTPPDFSGWVIHGHHHNNDLRHFPFINFDERRINVSAEVTGYVPLSLNEICTLIQSRQFVGNTSPILVKYPYVD